jgi:hypothetical protein
MTDKTLSIRAKTLRSGVYPPAHQPGLADGCLPGERYTSRGHAGGLYPSHLE